jgi:hypothetical protein
MQLGSGSRMVSIMLATSMIRAVRLRTTQRARVIWSQGPYSFVAVVGKVVIFASFATL